MEKFLNKYTFLVLAIAFGLMMAGSSLTQATSSSNSKQINDRHI